MPQPCKLLLNDALNDEPEKPRLIDFDNCINEKFDSLKELHNSLIYSAAKNGFKIIARDGTSGKKTPVRFVCDRNTQKKDTYSKTTKKNNCNWILKASKQRNKWVIYYCDNHHSGHELDPSMTVHLLLTTQQIQLIQSLKKKMEYQAK